jgi:hypothetical protein
MEQIFKVGDKVFDIRYGWGVVSSVNIRLKDWPVEVVFDGEEELLEEYTFDGRAYINYEPILSFTEYILEGFSQERPELLPNKGDIVWVRSHSESRWVIGHFVEKDDDRYFISCNNKDKQFFGNQLSTTNPYENEQ